MEERELVKPISVIDVDGVTEIFLDNHQFQQRSPAHDPATEALRMMGEAAKTPAIVGVALGVGAFILNKNMDVVPSDIEGIVSTVAISGMTVVWFGKRLLKSARNT